MKIKPTPLPIDIATFRTIRTGGYLYIDKTQHAYTYITTGRRFFLSRPRRFGKSLLISMLDEVLSGNKELFESLWIAQSDYPWHPHGVITIDLSALDIHTPHQLAYGISDRLLEIITYYQLNITLDRVSPGLDLRKVVLALHERFGRVALLIDEYDSPILRSLKDPELARAIRDALQGFFSVIKGLDAQINFVFITGVSSFAKAGLFSGMNNLQVLNLREQASDICGYTDAEIETYLSSHVVQWSQVENITYEALRTKIKENYNGYAFSDGSIKVYNPFSVMYALHLQKFENFWFSSGTPTFLITELKRQQQKDPDLFKAIITNQPIEVSQDALSIFDVGLTPLPALMFQTGYLTITQHDKSANTYQLGLPNHEVKQALQIYLLHVLTQFDNETAEHMAMRLKKALNAKDLATAIEIIKHFFAHIPYHLYDAQEKYYHAILQMILTVAGLAAQSEFATSHGRIDIVIDLPQITYIVEGKLNTSATQALAQIQERQYYERFLSRKNVILLGVSFAHVSQKFEIEYEAKELERTT